MKKIEWFLIYLLGLCSLLEPKRIFGDGRPRFEVLQTLLETGKLEFCKYSLVGPLFSSPLWYLGKIFGQSENVVRHFNWILFVWFLFRSHKLLTKLTNLDLARHFVLLILLASMMPIHAKNYYGEMFTTVFVFLGLMEQAMGNLKLGWVLVGIGVLNTPPALIGMGFVGLLDIVMKRRLVAVPFIGGTAILLLMQNILQRGHVFSSGYDGESGFQNFMPYSGQPGFSYPLLFGVVAILFSFGKGLFFYIPSLLLVGRVGQVLHDKKVLQLFYSALVFLIGLVIIYAKWWSWYGGWYWGPRFFLFGSVFGCLILAVLMDKISSRKDVFMLSMALIASNYICINGLTFDMGRLGFCMADDYKMEALCNFVPEFSPIFFSFIHGFELKAEKVALSIIEFLATICFIFSWLNKKIGI